MEDKYLEDILRILDLPSDYNKKRKSFPQVHLDQIRQHRPADWQAEIVAQQVSLCIFNSGHDIYGNISDQGPPFYDIYSVVTVLQ